MTFEQLVKQYKIYIIATIVVLLLLFVECIFGDTCFGVFLTGESIPEEGLYAVLFCQFLLILSLFIVGVFIVRILKDIKKIKGVKK